MQTAETVRSTPIKRGTCLIVEDNIFDSEKLSRVVEKTRCKMQVEIASTLHRAREKLRRNRPALILLDNNLPDGLGADFAIELSREQHHAGIPIIMVSDWPSPFMWEKAAAAGVRYVTSKTEFDGRYVRAALQQVGAETESKT